MTEIPKPTNGFAKRPGQPGRFYFGDFVFFCPSQKNAHTRLPDAEF
jgi:hypothetical protein